MFTKVRFSRKEVVTCANCSLVPLAPRCVIFAKTSFQRSQDLVWFKNTPVVWHLPQTTCTALRLGSGSAALAVPASNGNQGRQIFGDGGVVSRDSTYPVWRAGANDATTLHADANLDIGGLNVPAGTYTLYVLVKDPDNWKLIVNKQTGQGGDTYSPDMDLGRVDMKMEKPKTPVETLKYTITANGNTGRLQLEWENHIASVAIRAK